MTTSMTAARWREWLGAFVVGLLPWLVQPGLTQPDTKVDLTISPLRYLARSFDAWNSHAGLGELQNQAYGYLFPMGPVHVAGLAAGLPAWAVQRLWWSLLLLVGYAGARLLIHRFGLASGIVAVVAAAGYACGPRVLTLLADNSVEAWPYAVAPWAVLAALPLARRDVSRRARLHAAAASGLVAVALGGVNATASAAALVLPFILLLTHPTGRRRLPLWFAGVLLGALWWLAPLIVLGRYAYPFLDYIETSRITTAVTAPQHVLRGASDWVAYIVDADGHPVWQGGWVVAQSATSIVAGCLVAGLGIAGLLQLRGHARRFLLVSLLVGVVIMSVGHATSSWVTDPPLSGAVRSLLDGAFAPLRNVHKFDPLVRLPILLGLARLMTVARDGRAVRTRLAVIPICLLVVAAMTPVWQGRLGAAAAFRAIPTAWTDVAHAVDADAHVEGGSTLLLPSSRTASYDWGATTDEPLAALARSPVVYRASAPLGDPAATRVLDTVDELAAQGVSQPGLAGGLARMGIRRIVVRHDLTAAQRATPWQRVEATLRDSPGFTRLDTYGALTVWRVDPPGATAYSSTERVWGAAESTLALGAIGDLHGAVALVSPSHAQVVTDTLRRRVYNNGAPVRLAYGTTLPADDPAPQRIGGRDLPPGGPATPEVTRAYDGLRSVTATSSAADPFAKHYLGPGAAPWAAIDGDPTTAWLSGDQESAVTLTLRPDRAVAGELRIQLAGPSSGAVLPAAVEVRSGGAPQRVAVSGRQSVTVPVRAAPGQPISIALSAPSRAKDPVMGIVDVGLPGLRTGTTLVVPGRLDPARQQLLLTADPRGRLGSPVSGEDVADLSREVTLSAAPPAGWPVKVWLRVSSAALGGRCGAAGSISVDGRRTPLRVEASHGRTVEAVPCGAVVMGAGPHRVVITAPSGAMVTTATFGADPAGAAPTSKRPVSVRHTSASTRIAAIGAGGPTTLALTEGFNAGWQATDARGRALAPVRVDGWRQGFAVPAGGATTVSIEFAPTLAHRVGLLAGLVAAALLVTGWVLTRPWGRSSTRSLRDGTDTPGEAITPGLPQTVTVAIAVLTCVLIGGPVAVVAAAMTVVVPRRRLGELAVVAMGSAAVAMLVLGVVDQKSLGSAIGQTLACGAVAAVIRGLGR